MTDSINALIRELTKTAMIRRLDGISFMGAVDAMTEDKFRKSGSRLDHTLGVAFLTERICRAWDADEQSTMLAVSAAMLHDVGHTIFSHSAESYLRNTFFVDHSDVGVIIARHDEEIRNTLHSYGIEPPTLVSFFESGRRPNDTLQKLFNQPINPDTIEGIYRAFNFFEPDNSSRFPNPIPFFEKVDSRKFLLRADAFWRIKHRVYRDYINNYQYSKYDAFCTEFLLQQHVKLEELFLVDRYFEERFRWFVGNADESANLHHFETTSGEREYRIQEVEIDQIIDLRMRYTVAFRHNASRRWLQNLSSDQKRIRAKSWKKLKKLVKARFLANWL